MHLILASTIQIMHLIQLYYTKCFLVKLVLEQIMDSYQLCAIQIMRCTMFSTIQIMHLIPASTILIMNLILCWYLLSCIHSS